MEYLDEIFDNPLLLTPDKGIKLAIEKEEPTFQHVCAFTLVVDNIKYYIIQYIDNGFFEVHFGIVGQDNGLKNIHRDKPPIRLLATIIDRYKRKIGGWPIKITWPKNEEEKEFREFREFYKKVMMGFVSKYKINSKRIIETEDYIIIKRITTTLPESMHEAIMNVARKC